jgi:hypothetical protein
MTSLDFSPSGFAVFLLDWSSLAAMALEQIQRSTASAHVFFLTENTDGSACISYRRSRSLVSDRQHFGMVVPR